MLKKELLDTFRSTRAKIVFFVFLAIMVYDFVDKIYWQYQDYWFHPEAYPDGLAEVKHFSIAGFLNGGISSNNPQYLILWLLPIWCLLLCGDSPIREEKCGYLPLIETRISRKKYFWKKNILCICKAKWMRTLLKKQKVCLALLHHLKTTKICRVFANF